MNILLLTDYYLPHAGGARVYYHNIYKNLAADFPDQLTVLTKKVPGWEAFDRQESTESFRFIRRFKPLKTWKIHQFPKIVFPFVEALWLLRSRKIDLIHFGDLYPPGAISLILRQLVGMPYLAYAHGEEITLTDRYRYWPLLRNRIYYNADAVVAASEFARQNLLRIGVPEKRIHKITPGVDCERFRPRPPNADLARRYSLEGKTVLLTVGRLCPRKGHKLVIEALARIAGSVPNLRYLIIGKGSEEENLRRLAGELGLGEIVTVVGYVPEEELADFYRLSDLFVMVNREEEDGDIEGFGMVFLEANAAGKAVVAGRSGGTAEAVVDGTTGFLVDPEDVEELTATLKRLILNKGLLREMGSAGLQRANAEFSWKTRAAKLRELSRETLEAARAGAR